MPETLQAEPRPSAGKRHAKRLRATGKIPAVLYGHGEKTVSLAIAADQMALAIRHGSRVVELKGAVSDSALIRELQYDTFGLEILHVDFTRVSADERVHVKVRLELRGTAVGVKAGGVIEHLIHEIEIECPVAAIPEKVILNITELKLDGSMTVGQATLPEGAKILSGDDEIAVLCEKPMSEEEQAAASGEGAEPELIRKEKSAEDEEEKE
ncbi:MAG TPA: 50S ribosomal protein L25 [Pirellulales bacterium]|jgi:large subunit ribosomal protein L25